MRVISKRFATEAEALAYLEGVSDFGHEDVCGCPYGPSARGALLARWVVYIHDERSAGLREVCPRCLACYPWGKLTREECLAVAAAVGAEAVRFSARSSLQTLRGQLRNAVAKGRMELYELPRYEARP